MATGNEENGMNDEKRGWKRAYSAYLVRCWQEGTAWRYSLERVGENKRCGFDDLGRLLQEIKRSLGGPDVDT
jgi:hypothetical protein